MALLSTRDADRYERDNPSNIDAERVLHTIDTLFTETPIFPARFPDLVEKSTSHVRDSIANALDPNRDARIDDPANPHPGEPMAQQIVRRTEQERINEMFEGGVRGWMRRLLGRPPRNSEVMLPNIAADPNRGIRTFTQREVLGATYFLNPEYAERIMRERMVAEEALPEADRHVTHMRTFLTEKLGQKIWDERQDYPEMKWAMSFIANYLINPPADPTFNVDQFVRQAIGQASTYPEALRRKNQSEAQFNECDSGITRIDTLLGELTQAAKDLNAKCPGNYALKTLPYAGPPAVAPSPDNLNYLIWREDQAMANAMNMMAPIPAPVGVPGAMATPPAPATVTAATNAYNTADGKRRGYIEQLTQLTQLKSALDSKRVELIAAVNNPAFNTAGTAPAEAAAFLAQIDTIVPVVGDEIEVAQVTNVKNHLMAGQLKTQFSATNLASALQNRKDTLQKDKEKREKEFDEAKEVRGNKFTPQELTYRLFQQYFTHKQENGGFLNNDIPDTWINNDMFRNNVRQRALLATRFATSEAKDQSVFQSNKKLAEHTHNQRSRFSRFMAGARSSWLGNKIAMTFGRPEEVSFKEAMTRMRTVETDGKRIFAGLDLNFKPMLTRGDFKKALANKKVSLDDLPKLAAYLEELLKGSDKVTVRSRDAEQIYRTIRNLRIVRQMELHEKFLKELDRTPGDFNKKLSNLWKTEWESEKTLDWAAADEAAKREFITMLEKAHFSAEKKALRTELIDKLSKGEITIDDATTALDAQGFKVNRMGSARLYARARAHGAKLATVNVGKAAGNYVATTAAPVVNVVKKAPGAVLTYGVAKPLKFVGYTLPVGGAKLVYRSFKNVFTDLGSSFAETFGISSSASAPKVDKPKAAH